MSYTFLQEQGEESSAESFSDIPASVLSRLNLTAAASCSNASGTESCQSDSKTHWNDKKRFQSLAAQINKRRDA